MTDIETDTWPTREGDTVITRRDAVVGPPMPPPPEPDRRVGTGMLLALAVIALAVGGAAIAYFLTHRDTTSQVTTVVVRSTAPTGTAGKVVPSTTAAQATTTATAPSTTAPSTTTSPSTTTAPSTTSAGPPLPTTATMPDVSSQKETAAVQAMNQAGILPSLFFVPRSDPLGTVTGQAKSAGTTVPYHSHVQINLSSGPGDKPQEQVPSVVGQPLQQAVSAVNGAHLRLIYVKYAVSSRSQAGKIVQQSPLGGGHAPQNAQVLVFLGVFRG